MGGRKQGWVGGEAAGAGSERVPNALRLDSLGQLTRIQ